jgi:hypothetical protein
MLKKTIPIEAGSNPKELFKSETLRWEAAARKSMQTVGIIKLTGILLNHGGLPSEL